MLYSIGNAVNEPESLHLKIIKMTKKNPKQTKNQHVVTKTTRGRESTLDRVVKGYTD